MVKNDSEIRTFLDAISDAKLKNFTLGEYTIVTDRKNGHRLDHQGVNKDGSGKHRLYIQPVGGKSKASNKSKKSVAAQVHVTDPGNPTEIREALHKSFKTKGDLIKLA